MAIMLGIKERDFIDKIIFDGAESANEKISAYRKSFNLGEEVSDESIEKRITSLLNSQRGKEYYNDIRDSLQKDREDRALWNIEQSTAILKEHLQKAIENRDNSKITKTNSDAIITTVKELNSMYGLDSHNVNLNMEQKVVIYGEEDIPD
jgi:hypothetical protein